MWLQKSQSHTALSRHMTASMEDFAESSYFKRACCLLIATQLNWKELQEISEAFKALDTNCEGQISTSVMKNAMMSQLWFWERDEAHFAKVAENVDQDGDGYVEFSEFAAASIHSQIGSSDICRHAFDALDHDGSGAISFAELAATFEKPHVKEFEKQTGVDFLDLIRPVFRGCTEVSYKEFKELLAESTSEGKEQVPIPLSANQAPLRQSGGAFGGICTVFACCAKRGRDEV